MTIKEIAEILKEKGVKPSSQRVHVYKYLNDFRNHPTVEDIYNYLLNELPTLSKTTVYNTLDLFEEKGIVHSLYLKGNEKHYEIIIGEHSHFHCLKCDEITDIPYNEEDLNLIPQGYENYKVHSKSILLKGICPKCNKTS